MPDDLRSIDPTYVWVRHVRRGSAGDPSAQTIARGVFVRSDVVDGEDGLNGPEGWQDAEVTVALSDNGEWKLRLPNGAGRDGRLHRRRFAIFTADAYEPGEEWLEFWRDPEDLVAVGTPTGGSRTPQEVVLTGTDVAGSLEGFRTSEVDVWDGHAPVDVARHYARATVLTVAERPALASNQSGGGWAIIREPATPNLADCWTAEARLRVLAVDAGVQEFAALTLESAGGRLADLFVQSDGTTSSYVPPDLATRGKRPGFQATDALTLRLVAFYDRIFAFVNGELVHEWRRANLTAPTSVRVYNRASSVVLDAIEVTTLAPYASRGASATVDRRLPGLPPATGLRARYYSDAANAAKTPSTLAGRVSRLWPIGAPGGEPASERLDAQLSFPGGAVAPGIPAQYTARWEGAIYLDLAASDRVLRLTGPGWARIYVGKTRRLIDEAASSWTTVAAGTTLTVASLRAHLGQSDAGWYPIVVEVLHNANALSWQLLDGPNTGSLAAVPTSRLSPIGTYGEHVRNENHREVLGSVLGAFGYQWRTVPRQLESGEFPGQLAIAPRIGTDLDVWVTDQDVGTDVAVEVKADDVVDAMLADAAGVADPKGSGQLTGQMIDHVRALGHATLRTGYESLAEISERPMLRTRLESLLALRGSPNEVVGARPRGQRDLVDTFPLTGALRLFRHNPGDGVRLRLDSVDVLDLTPRQLTRVTWTLRQDGVGHPVVGFRQRPRTIRQALARLLRIALSPQRNYQGSLATMTGTWAYSSGPDTLSRVPTPADLDRVVALHAHVVGATAGQRFTVNGVDTGVPAPTGGSVVDLTPWFAQNGTAARAYVGITGAAGYYELQAVLIVRV